MSTPTTFLRLVYRCALLLALPLIAASARANAEALLPELHGIVILDTLADLDPAGRTDVGIVPSANPLTRDPAFAALLQPWLNAPLDHAGLDDLTRTIVRYFRTADRPMIDVVVPEQPIDSGTLQLLIIAARLDRIEVEGDASPAAAARLTRQIQLNPGETLDSARLNADLAWLNGNPFRSVQGVLTPGDAWGEARLTLRTTDLRPWRVFASADNTGNDLTGRARLNAGLTLGNLLGGEGQLTYQLTTATDPERLTGHLLSYQHRLPWRHSLELHGSYLDSAAAFSVFDLNGSSAQLGFSYNVPLRPFARWQHEAYAGFEWKNAQNQLEFGIPISTTRTQIGAFRLGYRFSRADPVGGWSGEVTAQTNPAGLFADQTAAAYAGTRPDADPAFTLLHLALQRVTRLPANLTLVQRLDAQWADTNLLPSEQLALGGARSVRGYDERALLDTDCGFVLQNELRLPSLAFALPWTDRIPPLQTQPLLFADYGLATAATGDSPTAELASVGAGIRVSLGSRFNLRIDYGEPLLRRSLGPGQWHLGAHLAY